jgi:hypothetical protein
VRAIVLLLLGVTIGCAASKVPEPKDVTGTVKIAGQPVTGVNLALQPTEGGMPNGMEIIDGAVKGTVVPGKYAYFIAEGKDKKAFEAIPEKYRAASLDRQVKISAGSTLEINLE